jgi:ABC-2 type transport system ATP-binding protein
MVRTEVLERFGLADLARRQTGGLSGGEKRRLAVALAMVGRPRLVVLDEPTTGLDVGARHLLWQALRDYHADGATVLLTSHYLEEIEALAERVVVIGSGRVLADDTLDAVVDRVSMRRVAVTLPRDGAGGGAGGGAATEAHVRGLPGVVGLERQDDRYELLVTDADALVRTLVATTAFRDLEVRGASLEEAFLALTATTDPQHADPTGEIS